MDYNSLNDNKNKSIQNKLIKLELRLKQLYNTKNNIQSKINTQSKNYDDLNTELDNKVKCHQQSISSFIDKIQLSNQELIQIEKKKLEDLEKELFIYKREKNRIEEKRKEIKSDFDNNLININTTINIIKQNNTDIKDYISKISINNKTHIQDKYLIRQNYKKSFDQYKKSSKQQNKTKLLYKDKINSINQKIATLYNKYNSNLLKRENGSTAYYELIDKIKELKNVLVEKENNIKIILQNLQSDNLIHSYNSDNQSSLNEFNRNETYLIKLVEEKDKIKAEIIELSEKPEYNLENYYENLDNENTSILKDIDILTNNKEQFENQLINHNKTTSPNMKSISNNLNLLNDNITLLNNDKIINKLNTRLKKNINHINYLNEELNNLTSFYNQLLDKENVYEERCETRKTVSKRRIDIKYLEKTEIINGNIINYNNQIKNLKNEIEDFFNNKKNYISKKRLLFNNHTPFLQNIKYEISNIEKSINKLQLLL